MNKIRQQSSPSCPNVRDHKNLKQISNLIILSCFAIVLLYIAYFYYFVKYKKNFDVVISNQVYRSAQPTQENLEHWQNKYQLASIINLRGQKDDINGLKQYSIQMSGSREPSPKELIKLVEVIMTASTPMLIHCKHGVDRTGLGSAVALLMQNSSVQTALQQFSIWDGFLPFRKQEIIKTPLYDYQNWLQEHNKVSSREQFIYWVNHEYRFSNYSAKLEINNLDKKIDLNKANKFQVRITNTSKHTMEFTKPDKQGVYLYIAYYLASNLPVDDNYQISTITPSKPFPKTYASLIPKINQNLLPGSGLTLDVSLPELEPNHDYVVELQLMQEGKFVFWEYGNRQLRQQLAVI